MLPSRKWGGVSAWVGALMAPARHVPWRHVSPGLEGDEVGIGVARSSMYISKKRLRILANVENWNLETQECQLGHVHTDPYKCACSHLKSAVISECVLCALSHPFTPLTLNSSPECLLCRLPWLWIGWARILRYMVELLGQKGWVAWGDAGEAGTGHTGPCCHGNKWVDHHWRILDMEWYF